MIHINIGSNLDSKYGTKFKNISIAINLLINSKLKIKRISNFVRIFYGSENEYFDYDKVIIATHADEAKKMKINIFNNFGASLCLI